VLQSSLGYFILPLVNVLLRVVFLREWLRPYQWLSIALAFGVVVLGMMVNQLPWIALVLAVFFESGLQVALPKPRSSDNVSFGRLQSFLMSGDSAIVACTRTVRSVRIGERGDTRGDKSSLPPQSPAPSYWTVVSVGRVATSSAGLSDWPGSEACLFCG